MDFVNYAENGRCMIDKLDMRGNSFGKMITVTSFGESHGQAIGVVIDGIPSNLKISVADLTTELEKRAPGRTEISTARYEPDTPEILSGILDDVTLGTPIAVIIRNTSANSKDYEKLKHSNRPGHADQTTLDKFGIRDHRGGGRSSGRETIARVIGGYFASLVIPMVHISFEIVNIGNIPINSQKISDEATDALMQCKQNGESLGCGIKFCISNLPAGLGEPVFDKLKADLAKASLSIGGCTAFSYGLGSKFAFAKGSDISTTRSNFGGIEGGISNGEDITFELTFKPPSTIGEHAKNGRHDPCLAPRVIPVVIGMTKIVLADHYLRQAAYNEFKAT